eukprot:2279586-Prymnesium_polylepis.1
MCQQAGQIQRTQQARDILRALARLLPFCYVDMHLLSRCHTCTRTSSSGSDARGLYPAIADVPSHTLLKGSYIQFEMAEPLTGLNALIEQ